MKLLAIILLSIISALHARRVQKCGPIDNKCIDIDKDGSCPEIPFCVTGFKRIPIEGRGCCCIIRDSIKGKKVVPDIVNSEKMKILTETLAVINKNYNESQELLHRAPKSTELEEKVTKLGRNISDAMKKGIQKLCEIADCDLETILKCIFDDISRTEDRKMNLILADAHEIYKSGNELLERMSVSMNGKFKVEFK